MNIPKSPSRVKFTVGSSVRKTFDLGDPVAGPYAIPATHADTNEQEPSIFPATRIAPWSVNLEFGLKVYLNDLLLMK